MHGRQEKKKVPAIAGWFTMDIKEPHLIGSRCKSCKDYFFPKEAVFCRNPHCKGTEFEEVLLSRKGTLWSFVMNHYKPPHPFISPEPFTPYGVAVTALAEEKMMVMGQLSRDCDYQKLTTGMEMELVLEKLYEDEENEYLVWKWKPIFA